MRERMHCEDESEMTLGKVIRLGLGGKQLYVA